MKRIKKEFIIGQRVDYILAGNVLFTGNIIDIDIDPKNKPYIIRTLSGEIKHANPQYLRHTPVNLPKYNPE